MSKGYSIENEGCDREDLDKVHNHCSTESEDDDVILIPAPKPPFIDLVSSDDETTPTEHGITIEIQSHNKTVEQCSSKRAADLNDNDIVTFKPPKKLRKAKTKATTKKSNKAGARLARNVIAEESLDTPDCIELEEMPLSKQHDYIKKASNKRKNVSNSDSIDNMPLSKRRRQQKTLSNAKASNRDLNGKQHSTDDLNNASSQVVYDSKNDKHDSGDSSFVSIGAIDIAETIEESEQSAEDKSDLDDERFDNNQMCNTEIGWNDEMRRFYNDSWGGETFNLRKIHAHMSKSISNWMLKDEDKLPADITPGGRRMRCLNCRDNDHLAKNCPHPPAKRRCNMCGVEGHFGPRCPNKICLLCGQQLPQFSYECGECVRDRNVICLLCGEIGHRQVFCPEQWRRYHSTTLSEELNVTNDVPKCTILSSDLSDYTFNFGDDVSSTGNTIYGRFRRAVYSDQNLTSRNDGQHIHDTFDSPIDVYVDSDFEIGKFDDVSSADEFADVTFKQSAAPDFIPLSKDKLNKQAQTSTSIVSNPATTTSIYLTEQHCKQLFSTKGIQFLRKSEAQYNVSVRSKWQQSGNALIVHGIASDQQNFHNAFKEFLKSVNQVTCNSSIDVPKNRDAIVNYVRSQLSTLNWAICNVESMPVMIQGIYHRYCQNEKQPSKENLEQNVCLRKHLNAVLCGRYGLGGGKYHLNALLEYLRRLMHGKSDFDVPYDVREKIGEHIAFIFSGHDHKNYENMIKQMKTFPFLPPLSFDRKLIHV